MACGLLTIFNRGTETWGIRVRDRRGHCTFRTYELTRPFLRLCPQVFTSTETGPGTQPRCASPPHTEGRARLRSGHTSPKRHPLLPGS
ncbi:hypothetical protein DICSQDRAFT_137589 [Dichomitus squalens LYAD-421 SS1]|uniref:Uncharacterized protein n=1 Tax=Dichomitus squalens (strain LYAD-421) TaxID=732165 RepID=R7SVN3_DICSQ|nr:uncharacterized protein DICSQDRAFT_137589 [Dichomitus squalens LYAD-421 SS1]EJF60244.1 hypothetical protein DICSQDRAFT_137589 [Dichomitus squalens LYAD-421 SS1]